MKQCPEIIYLTGAVLGQMCHTTRNLKVNKRSVWVPARPVSLNNLWRRFKATWLVFTGQADALVWITERNAKSIKC